MIIDSLVTSQRAPYFSTKQPNLSLRATEESAAISIVSTGYEIASSASLPRNDHVGGIWSEHGIFYEVVKFRDCLTNRADFQEHSSKWVNIRLH